VETPGIDAMKNQAPNQRSTTIGKVKGRQKHHVHDKLSMLRPASPGVYPEENEKQDGEAPKGGATVAEEW